MATVEMVSEETATLATTPETKPKRKYTRRAPAAAIKKIPAKKPPAKRVTKKVTVPIPADSEFVEPSYKLQAERLQEAFADMTSELNATRLSYDSVEAKLQTYHKIIVQLEGAIESVQADEAAAVERARRAEQHVATLLDLLPFAMTLSQMVTLPKGL